jgi:hypothetical protein
VTRALLFGVAALVCGAGLPAGPSSAGSGPATLAEAAALARQAWERRDLGGFVAAAAGNRILVSLPSTPASPPVPPDQATAILTTYVQGTEEVRVTVQAAGEVDSTRGYVRLERQYRLVGVPADRRAVILLAYRKGRESWVLTEIRITS